MVARKTAVQKSTAKATKAAPAGKSASGKKAANKTATAAGAAAQGPAKAAKKSAPRKKAATPARKNASAETVAPARKGTAGQTVADEVTAGKTEAGKTEAGKTEAGKTEAGKTAARKAAPADEAVPAKKTGARKVVAKKTPGGAPNDKKATATASPLPKARAAGAPVDPGELAVRPGEDPWSAEEVEQARTELLTEAGRLRTEILASEEAITGLMRDSGDGAGDDQADTGTKNITREHEMALAGNAREMLLQTERALERLDTGTYGLCENCGNAIGKARMQAFPRATLCVECKQRQERR
ncbi:TraR/DksA C4-type zinc finger protein [Streptomyces hygroscopicus]|uniref:TraR/DksA family transcriptional regulator n=1 Tax=Streptomyces hygroscopicus TaxID=1912 RepID=UPI000833034F|nr:TraR/DksA C4-type zinc finger protein [Streptomyces hygroscopicus]GLV73755.1 DNA-binding protein [Streptomyces hygroscopicus subsp. hygroscopicus]